MEFAEVKPSEKGLKPKQLQTELERNLRTRLEKQLKKPGGLKSGKGKMVFVLWFKANIIN